jgi:hypothetical protein
MGENSFLFNLLGLSLQLLGIVVGGLGVVGERFLDYLPMQTLVKALIHFLPLDVPLDVTRIPLFNAITKTDELQTGDDDRYNKWQVIIVLFMTLAVGFPFVGIVYLLPIPFLCNYHIIPFVWIIWGGISVAIHIFPAMLLSALDVTKLPNRVLNSPSVFLRRYAKLQVRYLFLVPLIDVLLLLILFSQIVMNWFAWVVKLNLADKDSRGRYYALYSFAALFIGTLLLIVSLFSM